MKKILFFLLLIPGILFAGGPQEPSGVLTIAVEQDSKCADTGASLGFDPEKLWYSDYVIREFTEETGIQVEIVEVKTDDNTTKKLDAMIAAGMAPNVYVDYAGRSGMYARPPLALPLNKYLTRDVIRQYYPSYIDMFSVDGDLYALPLTSWATCGALNMDLLKSIGMESILDDGLTFDEIYEAGKKLPKGKYATYMFANQSGGDYWMYTFWLSGFGAKLYNDDGSIGLNSPEGRAALTEMKRWYDEGLINKGAPGEGPGEFLGAYQNGHALVVSGNIGLIKGPNNSDAFNSIFVTTPKAPKVKVAPLATGPDAGVVFNIGTEGDKRAAAQLLAWVCGERYQSAKVETGRFPSMFGVGGNEDPDFIENLRLLEENGVFYQGIGTRHYQEIRALWFPMIQAILTDELTVEEGLARFEKEGNAIIAR